MLVVTPSLAQVKPEDDYKNLVKVSATIEPLGEHPFGARIDLFSGSLSFLQTDVALAGTGPAIAVSRSFSVKGPIMAEAARDGAFADWELALPRIETLIGGNFWQVDGHSYARCSNFSGPPSAIGTNNSTWTPAGWWKGYHLVVPGAGSQLLMNRDSGNFWHPPSMTVEGEPKPITFDIVTKSKWAIGCLESVNNAQGEGFIAISPDGTKYWFDHMVKRWAPTMERPVGSTPIPLIPGENPAPPVADDIVTDFADQLHRQKAMLLVTRIKDRFGNELTFGYDATHPEQITSIASDDGREVTFVWGAEPDGASSLPDPSFIQSITVGAAEHSPRIWTYDYEPVSTRPGIVELTSVTRPDNSQWTFGLTRFLTDARPILSANTGCSAVQTAAAFDWLGTMDAPSGLHGEFKIASAVRSRAQVPHDCWGAPSSNPNNELYGYALIPYVSYPIAITERVLSGAGIDTASDGEYVWTYGYSDPHPSWSGQSPPSGYECNGAQCNTRWVDVKDPEGNVTRSTFSTLWGPTEGQLLSLRVCDGVCDTSSATMRETVFGYASPSGGLWPDDLGNSFQNTRTNVAVIESVTPQEQRDVSQYYYAEDGEPDLDVIDSYTWKATAFNNYAQPIATNRYNDFDGSTTFYEEIDYLNRTDLWVLGLPDRHIRVDSQGNFLTEVDDWVYHTVGATLASRSKFGREPASYTWYPKGNAAAGELKSFTDARNHTTMLGSYKLGIPRLITYADNSTKSIEVDGFGQIAAITDEENDKTEYRYDNMGRLSRVIYPVDSVAVGSRMGSTWEDKVITYSFGVHIGNSILSDSNAEVLGEYWLRTVSVGDLRVSTHFDAMLRPILETTADNNLSYGNSQSNVRIDYESSGRALFKSYPVPGIEVNRLDIALGVHTVYDALGRPVQVDANAQYDNPATISTYRKYLADNKIEVTDPRTHITTTTYQAFDTPTYGAATHVEFADGTDTNILRDVYGKPLNMTQTGQYSGFPQRSVTHTFDYNTDQRLCLQVSPETGRTGYGYYPNGLLAWSAQGLSAFDDPCASSPNPPVTKKVVRLYDVRDRLNTINYPNGTPDSSFGYYDDGQIHTATRGAAEWTMTYFNRGILDTETLDIDGHSFVLDYGYNRYGSLSSTTYPSGRLVTYSPDALGRPTQLGTYADDIHYAENGRPSYFYYGNDVFFHEKLNMRGLPRTLEYRRNGEYYTYRVLGYDPNTNPLYILEDGIFGGGYPRGAGSMLPVGTDSRWFTYDELDRLTGITSTWLGTEQYSYDPLGNIRSRQAWNLNNNLVVNESWQYDVVHNRVATQVVSGNASQYSYDNDIDDGPGNVTSVGSFHSTYNLANETVTQSRPGFHTEFEYDARGWRVKEDMIQSTEALEDRYFIYDSQGRLMERVENGIITDYVYLGTRPVARIENGQTTYLHTDYQNSPLFETDGLGDITRYPVYYAYGQPNIIGNTIMLGAPVGEPELEDSPGYAGSYPSKELGLLYMGARFNHNVRFLSPDPAPLNPLSPVGLNRYAYANNNPVRFTDPTGRCVDAQFGCGAQGQTIASHPEAFAGAAPYAAAAAGALAAIPLAVVAIEVAITNPAAAINIVNGVGEALVGDALGGSSLVGGAWILANRTAGKAAEALAAKELVAEGKTILGSQVGARTSAGLRFIDHLIQNPGGNMAAVEVKAGNGVRNAAQLAKDGKMATEGAVLVGKNAPQELRGQQVIIETTERRYPNK